VEESIASGVNRANELILLVTRLDTLHVGALSLVLHTDSSGKVHGLILFCLRLPPTPVSAWRVRKGPGRRVKQNTCWHVCLFLHWQKPCLSGSRRLLSQIFTICC